jgi:hypothetical protein
MNAGRAIKRKIKRERLVSVRREQEMDLIAEDANYCRTTRNMPIE